MMPLPILLLALVIGVSRDAVAQGQENPPPPPPEPPLVLEPPPSSTFTISISYLNAPAAHATLGMPQPQFGSDRPVFVQIWRDTSKRRILVKHANGNETEGYLFETGYVIRSTANSRHGFVSQAEGGRRAAHSLYTRHFPGTQWLDMKFYKGIETDKNESFYVFEQQPSTKPQPVLNDPNALPPPDYDPLEYEFLRAKLRVPDKIPSEVQVGGVIYRYSPIQAWSGTISMPAEFQLAAEQFTKELSTLEVFRKKNRPQ